MDILRGLVIALMVLDHVRDYFHAQAFVFSPLDLERTTPLLFATRWITHLCAPTFVFLSGVSIFLQLNGGAPRAQVAKLALSRGAWLIALELTVIVFGFQFVWPYLFLQVIWAIGLGMVALSALLWLPRAWVLALGAVIVAGHGLLAGSGPDPASPWAWLWTLTMRPGTVAGVEGFVAYPAVPWIGAMLLGYGAGPLFALPAPRRTRVLAACALAALAAFALLRAGLQFGDPRPWLRLQGWRDVASFFNVSKQPPSLQYVLVTLGVSISLGLLLERVRGPLRALLLAYGRTPLFTYLLHIYLVHGLAMAIGVASGVPARVFIAPLFNPRQLAEAGWGVDLATVYAVWLLALALLYPCARWFAGVKRRRRERWLSYL
ncbi:DUF1624 domain-containing protein [Pseudomonas sp. CGJS7]|uniref:DUF1624 domain-containing protein n=1 Tax=Pseudomonas sp. CGJS7 TaxID=3109348 RepID=UPI0030082084